MSENTILPFPPESPIDACRVSCISFHLTPIPVISPKCSLINHDPEIEFHYHNAITPLRSRKKIRYAQPANNLPPLIILGIIFRRQPRPNTPQFNPHNPELFPFLTKWLVPKRQAMTADALLKRVVEPESIMPVAAADGEEAWVAEH
jgi:hypothetical protein